ncbi:hypothetical protein Tco_0262724 [Tanacetum coccineum]
MEEKFEMSDLGLLAYYLRIEVTQSNGDISIKQAATQALWLKRLLSKLTHSQEEKVTIQVDNKSAIALMKNPVFHGRSKHIDTKYHFIRECIEREDIQVKFVNGEYQKADILTKALPRIKFLTMRQLIGLKNLRRQCLRLGRRILGHDPASNPKHGSNGAKQQPNPNTPLRESTEILLSPIIIQNQGRDCLKLKS